MAVGNINIISEPIIVDANSHPSLNCSFAVDNMSNPLVATSVNTWINYITSPSPVSGNVYSITYTVNMNDSYNTREGYITISGVDVSGDTISANYYVGQEGKIKQESFYPVWKQIKYSLYPVISDYIDYTLVVSSGSSYNLRSYTIDSTNSIELNSIIADNISDSLDLKNIDDGTGNFVKSNTAIKRFQLFKDFNGVNSLCGDYNVYNDWSYVDYNNEGDIVYLSNPISYVLDSRQLFMFTIYGKSNSAETKVWINDILDSSAVTHGHYTFIQNLDLTQWPGDFENSFNNDFLHYYYGNVHSDADMILNVNNVYRYNVINSCKQYCLYYLNARGGWDSLLVDGKAIRTDKYTNYTYSQNYSNINKANWGLINYRKDVNPTWQLSTGYLMDSQAEKMHNILGSTKVYLHDLESNEIHSVIVNNNNCEYKTFNNQGRKMFVYTIEVEASQKQERR